MSMTKVGLVLENNNGNLKIQVDRTSACGACASSSSCSERKETIIELFSADNINKGDTVILESKSSDITKISAMVYVFPVIMLMIAAIAPSFLLKNTNVDINLITLVTVIFFLLLSVLFIKQLDKKVKREELMTVKKINGI